MSLCKQQIKFLKVTNSQKSAVLKGRLAQARACASQRGLGPYAHTHTQRHTQPKRSEILESWTFSKKSRERRLRACVSSKPRHALHHTAAHCNVLQRTATHCNTLQHTATGYNDGSSSRMSAQHTHTHTHTHSHTRSDTHPRTLCIRAHVCIHVHIRIIDAYAPLHSLQCTATHCKTLQHPATCKNTYTYTRKVHVLVHAHGTRTSTRTRYTTQ